MKYKFPKQKYKILKSRRTYKLDRELYLFLYIYIFRNRKKSEWNFQNFSRCMSLEPLKFRTPEVSHTTELRELSI
jgi:hypothetical protein